MLRIIAASIAAAAVTFVLTLSLPLDAQPATKGCDGYVGPVDEARLSCDRAAVAQLKRMATILDNKPKELIEKMKKE